MTKAKVRKKSTPVPLKEPSMQPCTLNPNGFNLSFNQYAKCNLVFWYDMLTDVTTDVTSSFAWFLHHMDQVPVINHHPFSFDIDFLFIDPCPLTSFVIPQRNPFFTELIIGDGSSS